MLYPPRSQCTNGSQPHKGRQSDFPKEKPGCTVLEGGDGVVAQTFQKLLAAGVTARARPPVGAVRTLL